MTEAQFFEFMIAVKTIKGTLSVLTACVMFDVIWRALEYHWRRG